MDSNLNFEQYLPQHRDLFYGGSWHKPANGKYVPLVNPATGESLGEIADSGPEDVESALRGARLGYDKWRRTKPIERGRILREVATVLRAHAKDLAMIDSLCGGNPVSEMTGDAVVAADQLEFFAGLIPEIKGSSLPGGLDSVDFSVREPLGVVARIIPFNHPLMFCAGKSAAPLAAGNAVLMKPPEQAPLSALRFAELVGHLLPAGVFNVVPGGRQVGAILARHPLVAKIALIGSVPTGKAVMQAASETLKPVLLELGGKNALIAYPDADPKKVSKAVLNGMNFTWCGQSCGSTSRAFIHESIYNEVIENISRDVSRFRPGLPTDTTTTMGAIIDERQYNKVLDFIEKGKNEGARLLCGGHSAIQPELKRGFFIEPTIFVDVEQAMTIAREEIFGPVLSILKWSDESTMLSEVNSVEYGLTCSIWTNDIQRAHRTASAVEVGYVWINDTSKHILGAPFGGYKHSGIGREECMEELIAFTQEKHIHIALNA